MIQTHLITDRCCRYLESSCFLSFGRTKLTLYHATLVRLSSTFWENWSLTWIWEWLRTLIVELRVLTSKKRRLHLGQGMGILSQLSISLWHKRSLPSYLLSYRHEKILLGLWTRILSHKHIGCLLTNFPILRDSKTIFRRVTCEFADIIEFLFRDKRLW